MNKQEEVILRNRGLEDKRKTLYAPYGLFPGSKPGEIQKK